MYYNAKRGIVIASLACRLSVPLSVRWWIRNSGSHKLEILKTNCTDN